MFGEEASNVSGNRLISFLNEVELVICNGRRFVSEPELTRVRPSLGQRAVIDYVVTDIQLMRESGDVQVDATDIGTSDHFLVWMELGRVANGAGNTRSIEEKVERGMRGGEWVGKVLEDWERIVNRVAKGEFDFSLSQFVSCTQVTR